MIALAVKPPFKHELNIRSLIDKVLEHIFKLIEVLFLNVHDQKLSEITESKKVMTLHLSYNFEK